ncbi:hypothetical protein IQ06DRAFT_142892 [Phaeosphaeriaceae sp. SRC1lsM3a]|nr:hypothetical protein IQ06DRAFT_142892 [Stagonospora sp. SRC1lsM3a]
MSVFAICSAWTMTSCSMLELRSLLLLILCPSCPWVNVSMCMLKQLLVCSIWRLLLLAERVVQLKEYATAEPQLHDYTLRCLPLEIQTSRNWPFVDAPLQNLVA